MEVLLLLLCLCSYVPATRKIECWGGRQVGWEIQPHKKQKATFANCGGQLQLDWYTFMNASFCRLLTPLLHSLQCSALECQCNGRGVKFLWLEQHYTHIMGGRWWPFQGSIKKTTRAIRKIHKSFIGNGTAIKHSPTRTLLLLEYIHAFPISRKTNITRCMSSIALVAIVHKECASECIPFSLKSPQPITIILLLLIIIDHEIISILGKAVPRNFSLIINTSHSARTITRRHCVKCQQKAQEESFQRDTILDCC